MSPPDEAKALNRVRKFLVEYGTVLSVGSSSRWNSIHLVIADTNESQGALDSATQFAPLARVVRAVIDRLPKNFRDDKLLQVLAEAATQTKRVKRWCRNVCSL